MNIYHKLQKCRAELGMMEIKESGNNKFAGYQYMELGDVLPHIVQLCELHGICTVVSFDEKATLTIFNSDKPEEVIIFTSPMSTAELKGCHPIQNLGAVETYLRRYLYTTAFEISEHDALDSTHKVEDSSKVKTPLEKPALPSPTNDNGPVIIQVQEVRENSGSKNGKPWKSWTVISTDGDKYGTFSETYAKLVARAEINHLMVEITHKPPTKYGMEIIDLTVLGDEDVPL